MSFLQTGSWFDDEATSLRHQIEEFGEWFQLQPYRAMQVNFPTSPDSTREAVTFQGVFERDAKDVSLGLEEVRVSTRHLCVTALICDVPNVRQNDRLVHFPQGLQGPPGEMFEVIDPRPDGMSGIELKLTQLGRQRQ